MKNRKLKLNKINISKINNSNAIWGGSSNTDTSEGEVTGINNAPTNTDTTSGEVTGNQ